MLIENYTFPNLRVLKYRFYLIKLTQISWTTLNSFLKEKNLSLMEISHQREPALLTLYNSDPICTEKKPKKQNNQTKNPTNLLCYQID